jgi:hypothetical protein
MGAIVYRVRITNKKPPQKEVAFRYCLTEINMLAL